MLTAGTDGTLYEIASVVFNDTVLINDGDWDIYYGLPSDDMTHIDDLMDEIIGEMIQAADRAMTECALHNKYKYLKELRSHA